LGDLLSARRLSHVGSDGTTFGRRALRAGYDGYPAAENLAWNQATAVTVVESWLASPSHRDALLMRGVTHLGVAYRCSPRHGHFWAMVVGQG
ncbi:MAG: CAP domain-containing protein, partial [Pacificimonas sp.]